jgi:hypothetical protein
MENKLTEVEQAKAILKQHGYYVDNLWTIQDVTDRYECLGEGEAQEVLLMALTNEWVMEQIWFSIDDTCNFCGIKLKEDDED